MESKSLGTKLLIRLENLFWPMVELNPIDKYICNVAGLDIELLIQRCPVCLVGYEKHRCAEWQPTKSNSRVPLFFLLTTQQEPTRWCSSSIWFICQTKLPYGNVYTGDVTFNLIKHHNRQQNSSLPPFSITWHPIKICPNFPCKCTPQKSFDSPDI
jgi:hypothetical protein